MPVFSTEWEMLGTGGKRVKTIAAIVIFYKKIIVLCSKAI